MKSRRFTRRREKGKGERGIGGKGGKGARGKRRKGKRRKSGKGEQGTAATIADAGAAIRSNMLRARRTSSQVDSHARCPEQFRDRQSTMRNPQASAVHANSGRGPATAWSQCAGWEPQILNPNQKSKIAPAGACLGAWACSEAIQFYAWPPGRGSRMGTGVAQQVTASLIFIPEEQLWKEAWK